MKEIFDWLREQLINERDSLPTLSEEDECFDNGINCAIDFITEAEAKWESDCCEWTPNKYVGRMHYTSCGYAGNYNANSDKYCKHCGKPIKIVEVE